MSTATRERDYYFDNAKFILIFLVVFGHFISPIKGQNEWLYTIYNFIYTFHMPAFILIGGFFTKGVWRDGYLTKIFKKIFIPYLIFQIVYSFFYYDLYGKSEMKLDFFDPHWTLWFLLSLLFWNVLLKLFVKMKHPLILAIGIGVAVGYIHELGTFLSLMRTFVFFPVFLLGHLLEKRDFKKIMKPSRKAAAAVFLVVLFITYHFFLPNGMKEWFLASSSYSEIIGYKTWFGGLIRLVMYGVMFLATFSVLALIPRRKMFFTAFGERTLYIYLLHGFILKYLFTTELFASIKENGLYFMLLFFAVIVTLFLASKPVIAIAQPLIELRWSKLKQLFKQKPSTPSRPQEE
ncbi:acyltransferase family protein [Bacillus sp. NEB1478]|uniref:acyltransferase family protein n=1 Tax=Bacillus sp. NEB1478 TaxID=3073816 RepID=UPI002873CB6B|nr:acyltransferase family protein [Bacillus sp. NEB1478]WNB91357.1 acyltransferase family protein [Bacillus sp. NEB1478]